MVLFPPGGGRRQSELGGGSCKRGARVAQAFAPSPSLTALWFPGGSTLTCTSGRCFASPSRKLLG